MNDKNKIIENTNADAYASASVITSAMPESCSGLDPLNSIPELALIAYWAGPLVRSGSVSPSPIYIYIYIYYGSDRVSSLTFCRCCILDLPRDTERHGKEGELRITTRWGESPRELDPIFRAPAL